MGGVLFSKELIRLSHVDLVLHRYSAVTPPDKHQRLCVDDQSICLYLSREGVSP